MLVLKILSFLLAISYILLFPMFPQYPWESGVLAEYLGESLFLQIYIVTWILAIIYELIILLRFYCRKKYQCTCSIFLPAAFYQLYQYYPPFPILSQFFCFLVLSVKVIEIIFWHKRVKNNAPNQGIQILLEFLVMTSILITTFFC